MSRDGEVITVAKNQRIYIPIGAKHRFENRGKVLLQLFEVQLGDYLEAGEIKRVDDDYGRTSPIF